MSFPCFCSSDSLPHSARGGLSERLGGSLAPRWGQTITSGYVQERKYSLSQSKHEQSTALLSVIILITPGPISENIHILGAVHARIGTHISL